MIKNTIFSMALLGMTFIPAMAQDVEQPRNKIEQWADTLSANRQLSERLLKEYKEDLDEYKNDLDDYKLELDEYKKQLDEEKERLHGDDKQVKKKKEDEPHSLERRIWNDRAKYFNISYVKQSLSVPDDNCAWNNDLGVAITSGRTYYLHKKPILGMIKFGLDWSYLDINFGMYKDKFGYFDNLYYGDGDGGNYYEPDNGGGYDDGYEEDYDDEGYTQMYQAEIGMQFGPSVTINPIDHLKVNGYFRVTPSYSILYNGEEVLSSYGTFFSCGGAISYKVISLGIEGRWGNTKYGMAEDGEKMKFKTGSTRFYVSFRF